MGTGHTRMEVLVTKRLLVITAALILLAGLAGTVAEASLNVQVVETGQISISADGAATRRV